MFKKLTKEEMFKVLSKDEFISKEEGNNVLYSLGASNYVMSERDLATDLDKLLYEYDFDCDNHTSVSSVVFSDYKDYGRWSNLEIDVLKLTDVEDKTKPVFVKRERIVGSTEMQENGEITFTLVEPHVETIITYK